MRENEKIFYQKVLKKSCYELESLNKRVEICCSQNKGKHVPGTGFPLADILFIKDSPQDIEIKEGKSFGAQNIENIQKGLKKLSIEEHFSFFTNLKKCYACESGGINKKCLSFLKEEIDIINPKVIVIFGKNTQKAISKFFNINNTDNEDVISTPLADLIIGVEFKGVFADQMKKKKLWEDLKKIKKSRL
jgi:uracil-DNA glycosylase family 4